MILGWGLIMADWDEESWQLATNLDRLLLDVSWRSDAPPPDRETVRKWHRIMMTGLRTPHSGDKGTYRGEGTLKTTGVFVRSLASPYDRIYGVAPEHVHRALGVVDASFRRRLVALGSDCATGAKAELAAWIHGEWIRIHPFANGNGRIARLLANWVLLRLDERPVVRLRPRPEGLEYLHAAMASMLGDHARMRDWILRHLNDDDEP